MRLTTVVRRRRGSGLVVATLVDDPSRRPVVGPALAPND